MLGSFVGWVWCLWAVCCEVERWSWDDGIRWHWDRHCVCMNVYIWLGDRRVAGIVWSTVKQALARLRKYILGKMRGSQQMIPLGCVWFFKESSMVVTVRFVILDVLPPDKISMDDSVYGCWCAKGSMVNHVCYLITSSINLQFVMEFWRYSSRYDMILLKEATVNIALTELTVKHLVLRSSRRT